MASLVNLSLERAYRSSHHELGRDLLSVLLGETRRYERAVGFFSSSVFTVAAPAFHDFFAAGGRMSLVCCPIVSRADYDALVRGTFRRGRARDEMPFEEFVRLERPSAIECSQALAALIARGLVEVRVATIPRAVGTQIYHEKIGIFVDDGGQTVATSGSANETRAAYGGNFERIDVFSSFGSDVDRRRASAIEQQFRALWNNETTGVEVLRLDVALRRRVFSLSSEEFAPERGRVEAVPRELSADVPPETLFPAPSKPLRKHQDAAIKAWAKAGGRGILEMATGSGKTVTALALAARLFERLDGGLAVIVVAPLIHLVDQWREVSGEFGLDGIRCAGGRDEWFGELSTAISALNAGQRPILSVVTTAATLLTPSFQELAGSIRRPVLLIADEAHNYGTEKMLASLPENATYRVGLSATPENPFNAEAGTRLKAFFGESVFSYGLKDALRDGVLTPYRYYPQIVTLTTDETDKYLELSQQIGRYSSGDGDGAPSDAVKMLLVRRARLVASAAEKLPRLRALLAKDLEQTHVLVYCGDGSTEGPDPPAIERQLDAVLRMVGSPAPDGLGIRCAKYTAETEALQRQALLRDFGSGDLQALVAIRCLDEGVDVPATRRAFMLASSMNPRQFIQRRGRVLRRFPGKERAEIYDFFVTLPMETFRRGERGFATAQALVRGQLARVREFCDLAENGPSASAALLAVREHFDLLAEG